MKISIEAKKKYVERRRDNLVALENALKSKDSAIYKTIGHQLKGNARTFGFEVLEPVAVKLEQVGINEDWASAESLLLQFRNWLEKTEIEIGR